MSSAVQTSGISARRLVPATLVVALMTAAALLVGCGERKKDKPASQTAAKVNKEEITVHQINFVLSQQRIPADMVPSASKQVLERLIDQELALQKATEQRVDRDPRVIQQLEAARREIIVRAYMEKLGNGASKPTPDEIKAYYDAHPALFKDRKVYNFEELSIEAKSDAIPTLRAKLAASKDLPEFVAYLKSGEYRYAFNQGARAAEQLPLSSVDQMAKMKDGERLVNVTPRGVQVLVMVSAKSQPVEMDRASPAIEQFLLNERKRKLVEDDLKALHGSAKIEYVGEYAKPAASAPAASEPAQIALPPIAPASAAPQLEVAPIETAPSSTPSTSALDNGIRGLK